MKIYTNEIDLARPILKKFYTAPCSDYKFGVKIVQGMNYVIELNGVKLKSDGNTGGYATYKMTSPNEQGVELFKIICENGQIAYIKHVTTDSTVFDVDEGEGGSVEIPTKTSELENDSDFATNTSVDEKIGVVTSSIPTKTSELENDSNFTTNASVDEKIGGVTSSIPTKTSQLQNDSGFITVEGVPTKTSELVNDSDFATNASVDEKIGGVTSSIPTKTSQLDNDSNFTTKTELDTVNQNLTTSVLNMQKEVDTKATTEYVDSQIGQVLTQEVF